MINFTVISLLAFGLAALMLWRFPAMDALVIAGIVSAFCLVFGFGFFPFGMAIWIYFDHRLHPLEDGDRLGSRD